MKIIEDDLTGEAVQALLAEHLTSMVRNSPPGCVYALDLDELRAPEVSFWSAWSDSALLGCGALKELTADHGEIKSMRTTGDSRGRGVGSALLQHIIDEAHRRAYTRLSLETGSGKAFEPALSLYRKFGFAPCGPFADYPDNRFSRFMTLDLQATQGDKQP